MASTAIQSYYSGSHLVAKTYEPSSYSIHSISLERKASKSSVSSRISNEGRFITQPVTKSTSENPQYRLRLPSLTAKKLKDFPNNSKNQTGYIIEMTSINKDPITNTNSKCVGNLASTSKMKCSAETQLPECTVIRETLRNRSNSLPCCKCDQLEINETIGQKMLDPTSNQLRTNNRSRTQVFRENIRKRRKLKKVKSAVARVCASITWNSAEKLELTAGSNDSSTSYERVYRSGTIQLHSALNGVVRQQTSVPEFRRDNPKIELELVGAPIYCNAPPNSSLHHHSSDLPEQSSTPLSRRKNTGNVLVSPNRDLETSRCDDLIALGKVAAIKNELTTRSISPSNRSRSQNATAGAQTGQVMQLPLNGFLPKSSINPTLTRMRTNMSKPQSGLSTFAAMYQSSAQNNDSAKNGVSNKTTSRASGGDHYADPVTGAQSSFQVRLQEMVMLEGETIKYERQKKLGRRRLKYD